MPVILRSDLGMFWEVSVHGSQTLVVTPIRSVAGTLRPPSDKSLTHRSFMFSAIADGPCVVRRVLRGEDCLATLTILGQLGLRHEWMDEETVRLIPAEEWLAPADVLDCGNSGTSMRLLAGLLAGRPFSATLVGDSSLSRRPMRRVTDPLRQMGAEIEGDFPPLSLHGGRLKGIDYVSPIPSAQVKSCLLLAGLRASGRTSVTEPSLSRDHTERMLTATGVRLDRDGNRVSISGGQRPQGFEFSVPSDISSAAFAMVASMLFPDGSVTVEDLGLNPTRTGILDVLADIGAEIGIDMDADRLGEPVGKVYLKTPRLRRPFQISGALVPRLIDEIPVLAVLATQCEGTSFIRDARELRVKESDRIEVVADGLRRMGAEVETFEDGMSVRGPVSLSGISIDAQGDHRIAMAFYVAGLIAAGSTSIHGAESIRTSYPEFESDMRRVAIV